ncbi:HrHNF-6 [Aphelenchoides besseyi]|nr:HrHNF-6 [Aphelenchoides besseyi]
METLDGCYDPLLSAANGCIDAPLSPPSASLLLAHGPSVNFDCDGSGYYAAIATSGQFASLPPITTSISSMNATSAISPALTDSIAGGVHAFSCLPEDVGRYACVAHQLPSVSDAYNNGMVTYAVDIKYEYDTMNTQHSLLQQPPKTPHSPDDVAAIGQQPQLPALLLAHSNAQQQSDEAIQYFDYSAHQPPPHSNQHVYSTVNYPTYAPPISLQPKSEPATYETVNFDCYTQDIAEENDRKAAQLNGNQKCSLGVAASVSQSECVESTDELNTRELAQRISAELKRYSIPQAIFAQRVLCRSQGTLSDLLRNPKPWSKLKSGRETFRRMAQWLSVPEVKRMSELRLAVVLACKRKEEQHQSGNTTQQTQHQPTTQSSAPKKPRLVFTPIQRQALQSIFKNTQRPSRELQVTISQHLGLDVNTIANFFMNARRRGAFGMDEKSTNEEDRDDGAETSELDSATADLLRLAKQEQEAESTITICLDDPPIKKEESDDDQTSDSPLRRSFSPSTSQMFVPVLPHPHSAPPICSSVQSSCS